MPGEGDPATAVDQIGLPLVVKPVTSWARGTASVLRSRSMLARRGRRQAIWSAGGGVIVQEVCGATWRSTSSDLARIVARFARVAHRVHPPLGGCSVVRESIPLPPDATEAAENSSTRRARRLL